jgi:hypothetical protein
MLMYLREIVMVNTPKHLMPQDRCRCSIQMGDGVCFRLGERVDA